MPILGHGVMLGGKAWGGQELAEAGQRAFLAGLSAFVEVPAPLSGCQPASRR